MTNTFFSWNTHKTETGAYLWTVKKVTSSNQPFADGKFAQFETLTGGISPTRARAKSSAQAWIRSHRTTVAMGA